MDRRIGTSLGPYEIEALVGSGGMGQVYRARDTRLQRRVALKILSGRFAQDTGSRERLLREARSISALNHPSICTLHDVGDQDGTDFLVMEYVDGDTLAQRIAKGPIPVGEAVALALEITDALGAAHAKSIVHRDLKPANIKVTPDGHIKVLDFGLAKGAPHATEPDLADSPTFTAAAHTGSGVILGTAAYMSPEQARGRVVDARADIWAFGCILFEMISGRRTFIGESVTDVLASVLTRTPNWADLPVDTPAPVQRLLRRCLEKDVKRRLRDIADARFDLEEAAEAPSTPTGPHAQPARRVGVATVAVLAIGAAAFLAGAWWNPQASPFPRSWQGERLGGSSIAFEPKLSPDGKILAFQAMERGQTQVAIMKPESGNWQVLTRDRTRGLVQNMNWSPDGTRIFFDRFFELPRGIYSVPVFGGDERLVLENAMAPIALKDASLLVTRINDKGQDQLFRFWPDSRKIEALPAILGPDALVSPAVRVFADGREAVFLGRPAGEPDREDALYALDLQSGRTRRLAPDAAIVPDWKFPLAVSADDQWVVFDQQLGNAHQIVAARRDGSPGTEPLFTVTSKPLYLDVGPDGSIYVDLVDHVSEITRVVSGQPIERLPAPDELRKILELPDGRLLAEVQMAGRTRIMVVAAHGDLAPFLEAAEDSSWPAAMLGPDRVALFLGAPPQRTIVTASAKDGRVVERLSTIKTEGITTIAGSPDGRTLYFVRSGQVWAAPVGAGEPRLIRAGDSVAVDPLGRYIVIEAIEHAARRLVRVPVAGGPEENIPVIGSLRLVKGLTANAVAADGRILSQVALTDSWFWPAGIIDQRTGRVSLALPGVDADMTSPGWTRDGRLTMAALTTRAAIWRFRPVER